MFLLFNIMPVFCLGVVFSTFIRMGEGSNENPKGNTNYILCFLFLYLSWILSAILEFFFETDLFLRYYFGMPVQKSSLTNRFCASAETALVWSRFHHLRCTECVHADLTFTVSRVEMQFLH